MLTFFSHVSKKKTKKHLELCITYAFMCIHSYLLTVRRSREEKCVKVFVWAHMQVKLMSHLISVSTKSLFTLLYYHLLTQSHDLRAKSAEMWAPKRARQNVMRDKGLWPNTLLKTHTHTQAAAQPDLLLSPSNVRFSFFRSFPAPLTFVTICSLC